MLTKCAIDLENDCATCGVGSKWLENWVSLQFASQKRYRSNQESDRFEDFCNYAEKRSKCTTHLEAESVPNV